VKIRMLLLILAVACLSGCASAWVGNSPMEIRHRHPDSWDDL